MIARSKKGVLAAAMVVISTSMVAQAATVWLTGDSTAANWSQAVYPYTGWGQVLPNYLDSTKMKVRNIAFNGASIVSYTSSGYWKRVTDSLKKGDYLLVQFAHNTQIPNSTETIDSALYSAYLDTFYRAAVRQGATPIFLTANNPAKWAADTVIEPYCQPGLNFCAALMEKAKKLKVPVLDLQKLTTAEQERRGYTYSRRFWYAIFDSGEYANYPTGKNDFVHLQEMGALNVANLFTKALAANTDTSLNRLRSAVLPCDSLLVFADTVISKDSITASGCYVPGSPITLKILGPRAKRLKKWTDQQGRLIDTAKMLMLKMPKGRTVRNAVFQTLRTADVEPKHGLEEQYELRGDVLSVGDGIQTLSVFHPDGRPVAAQRISATQWKLPGNGVYLIRMAGAQTRSSHLVSVVSGR